MSKHVVLTASHCATVCAVEEEWSWPSVDDVAEDTNDDDWPEDNDE